MNSHDKESRVRRNQDGAVPLHPETSPGNGGKKVDVADGGWEPLAPSAEAFADGLSDPARNDAVLISMKSFADLKLPQS